MREQKITNRYGWEEVEDFLLRFNLLQKYGKLIEALEKNLNIAFHKTELIELDWVFCCVQTTLYVSPSVPQAEVYKMQTKAVEILERPSFFMADDFVVIVKHHNGETP